MDSRLNEQQIRRLLRRLAQPDGRGGPIQSLGEILNVPGLRPTQPRPARYLRGSTDAHRQPAAGGRRATAGV